MDNVIIAGGATVIGALLGVAAKCAVDFSRDKQVAEKLWGEYRPLLEAELRVTREYARLEEAAWDEYLSSLCFHRYWGQLDATHHSEGVKVRVRACLSAFFNEHALKARVTH